MPATLRDQVAAPAAYEGRTVSDVLRALLKEYVDGEAGDVPGQPEQGTATPPVPVSPA